LYICINSIAMKKIIILSFLLLVGTSLKAQTIIPLEDHGYQAVEPSNDTYFKDINHLLDKFIGAWSGVYNGNTIVFYITKTTKTIDLGYRQVIKDCLIIRHTVADASGNVIIDVTSLLDDDINLIQGIYFDEAGCYHLNYSGYEDTKCKRMGSLVIDTLSGDTQMKAKFIYEQLEIEFEGNCVGEQDQIFSEDTYMVLDKQ